MAVVTTSVAAAYSLVASQHVSSIPHISFRRRPTTSLHAMMPSTPFLLSSSYSSASFPTIPIPVLSPADSHHIVIVRGVFCPSPSIRKYCATCNWSSKYLNSFACSYVKPTWTPPLIVENLYGAFEFAEAEGRFDYSERRWLVMMETFGIEFDSEQALFNHYIKTLAAVVGSAEEAKRRIYVVSCGLYFGFGAEIDKSIVYELTRLQSQLGIYYIREDFEFECRDKKPRVQAQFNPLNQNHRLDDLFSYHHLSAPNLEWSSDHWLVHIKQPGGEFTTEQETIDLCYHMVADVVGSAEEAIRKIYIIWNKSPFGFGVEADEDTSNKLKAHPDVLRVLPDYAFDVKIKYAVLVISPSSCSKSDPAYYNYQSKDLSVQPPACFTLRDLKCRLGNVLSYHHLSEPNVKWNSDHWLIITKQPEDGFTGEAQTLDFYIRVLAEVVGSEQEAKEKIYVIWCKFPFGFGAEIDGKTSNKLKDCLNVLKVVPDYAFDVKDKFTGIRVIPSRFYELKFHYYEIYRNWGMAAKPDWVMNCKLYNFEGLVGGYREICNKL